MWGIRENGYGSLTKSQVWNLQQSIGLGKDDIDKNTDQQGTIGPRTWAAVLNTWLGMGPTTPDTFHYIQGGHPAKVCGYEGSIVTEYKCERDGYVGSDQYKSPAAVVGAVLTVELGGGLLAWGADALVSLLPESTPAAAAVGSSVQAGAAAGGGTAVAGVTRADIMRSVLDKGIQITNTVGQRLGDNIRRFVPPSVVEQALRVGRAFNDPQGAKGMVAFFTTTVRNGKEIGVKVVYDVVNQVVTHVHFDDPARILRGLEKAGEISGF